MPKPDCKNNIPVDPAKLTLDFELDRTYALVILEFIKALTQSNQAFTFVSFSSCAFP